MNAPHTLPEDFPATVAPTIPDGFPAITPDETAQQAGLRHLAAIADEQAAGTGTVPFPAVTAEMPATAPRAAHSRTRTPDILRRHGARLASFSVTGIVVLILGIAVQALLIRARAGTYGSYAGQAVFSIELSWALSRLFTWRDRDTPPWSSWWRFNLQKLALTIPNLALYGLLTEAGTGWLAANLATTAVFTTANYITGDLWSFAARTARSRAPGRGHPSPAGMIPPLPRGMRLPTVSVVIPCKGNQRTIRATVDALLAQDYPGLAEVILVGDENDPTWTALVGVTDPRLILLEQERTPGQRDPNVKRHKGLTAARGDLLALADSDIVMDPDWLSKAVALLTYQGGGLVAGGMRAIRPHKFWPRFVDRNAIAAKTSRLPRPYFVTAENFGARNRKPPLTANAVFTRHLYDACPLDAQWAYGYEDYEWYWRLARSGHRIQYHGALTAAHHHREKFSQLAREYRRSAQGCAQFTRRHPDSPLARKRRAQALLLPLAAIGMACGAAAGILAGHPLAVAAVPLAALLVLGAREAARSRSAEALAYPAIGLALAGLFTWTLTSSLARPRDRAAALWNTAPAAGTATRPLPPARPRRRRWPLLVIAVALAAGAAVRLWNIGTAPEWQLDEITYNSIASNLIAHGTLNVPLAFQQKWQPFLYHPPFYPYELSFWYRLAGEGITQARILGVLTVTAAFALLARLLAKLHGPAAAAFATVLITTDGWLVYAGRISYIENSVLVLMMAALNLYEKALRTGQHRDYILAGMVTGAAASFNNDAAYLIPVLAIHWLLIRRDFRQHLAAIGSALLVVLAYIAVMIRVYTTGGTDWWLHDTLVQLRRITGDQASAGTLTSPAQFVTLLTRQYDLFLPSVTIAIAAVVLLAWRLARCARRRTLEPLGGSRLLAAWAIGALAVFGPASLHYSQYFVMVLLPLYSYLWVHVWPVLARARLRAAAPVLTAVVVALGLGSAGLRLRQDSNAFRQFQQYAATRIPRHDLIVAGTAGDPLAYVISQPWCSPGTDLSRYCSVHAAYVATWQTYLQPPNPLHLESLQLLLARSRPVAEFRQFSGTITVWKVTRPAREAGRR